MMLSTNLPNTNLEYQPAEDQSAEDQPAKEDNLPSTCCLPAYQHAYVGT